MIPASALFLERIDSLAKSAAIEAVTNKGLSDQAHNNIAKMLRNGLAVVGFTALEDFLKTRTAELLSEIGRTGVPFQDLPEKLKVATTYEAVSALSYQLSIRNKADRMTYIQDQALKLASTAQTAYELTPHAFGYDQANLQEDSVKQILKCFLVEDPWGQMTRIGARLGLVALPLEETFRNAARRRHRAAHVAHADTPQMDLAQFIKEAFAIAISFDALLSRALDKLRSRDHRFLTGQESVSSASITIRSVKGNGSVWKEYLEGRNSAVRVERDLAALINQAKARAVGHKDLFVQFGFNGEILSWECH